MSNRILVDVEEGMEAPSWLDKIPPFAEKVLEKEQKKYEQINKEYRERKQKALRQFDLFEEIRTDNKFIDRYKNFQYKPNGGFIRGK